MKSHASRLRHRRNSLDPKRVGLHVLALPLAGQTLRLHVLALPLAGQTLRLHVLALPLAGQTLRSGSGQLSRRVVAPISFARWPVASPTFSWKFSPTFSFS